MDLDLLLNRLRKKSPFSNYVGAWLLGALVLMSALFLYGPYLVRETHNQRPIEIRVAPASVSDNLAVEK